MLGFDFNTCGGNGSAALQLAKVAALTAINPRRVNVLMLVTGSELGVDEDFSICYSDFLTENDTWLHYVTL